MDMTHNCLLGNYMQNMILNIIIYGIFAGKFMTQLIKHNRSILYGVMGYPLIILIAMLKASYFNNERIKTVIKWTNNSI